LVKSGGLSFQLLVKEVNILYRSSVTIKNLVFMIRRFQTSYKLLTVVFAIFLTIAAAHGQSASIGLAPINLAQAAPPPQFIPTDVTPFTTAPERSNFSPGYKFRLFQTLPERLWFNFTTEVSQRLDTNVLFTYSHPKANYAFRVLPNLTVGYNIAKNTSLYCNYFVIKDVFARDYNNINFPTTQSLSMGIRHVKQFNEKTTLQYDFQARELWQNTNLHQFDFLPGATLTHVINQNHIVYASTILQLRGGDYFVAPTREIDPFYTLGYIYRHKKWTFIATDTLVTNFRHPPFNDAVPNQSNVSMITDLEINHPVSKKFNGLLVFVRAEPVWNWDSNKVAGLSGFDFRLFSGLRLALNKPSYYGAVEDLRKKVMSTPKTDSTPDTDSDSMNSSASTSNATPNNNSTPAVYNNSINPSAPTSNATPQSLPLR